MIESITLSNTASYGPNPEVLSDLRTINFIFGSNGTGKTTISRVIADESANPPCRVSWRAGTKLQTVVYNHDYVERNFSPSAELKGVFTLGEDSIERQAEIANKKLEIDGLQTQIDQLTINISGTNGKTGKSGESAALDDEFKDKCWRQKRKHDDKLKGAFEGYRNSADKFRDKILEQWKTNRGQASTLAALESSALTVFGQDPIQISRITYVPPTSLTAHEINPVLAKCVIGKGDVDIAAMIHKLGNSDWVKQGISFYRLNDSVCPFCQQATSACLAKSLAEYFDDQFERDSDAITALEKNYSADSQRLIDQLESILKAAPDQLASERLRAASKQLSLLVSNNRQRISDKLKEPSRSFDLEPLAEVTTEVAAIIASANEAIDSHNQVVLNISKERSDLTSSVWRYLVETELRSDIEEYLKKKENLTKAIDGMKARKEKLAADKSERLKELRALESRVTSVQPTIDGINKLLESFGYEGFKLKKAAAGTSYKIVRPDGSDAKHTLSEGEKTFIAFLYFYHLLKGSHSESGTATDRIVVIDDPVSSLDSDILFVVGSLVKSIFNDIRTGTGHVKQAFVLTHNVYFHKEVSFNPKRNNGALNEETFWVVKKTNGASNIVKHVDNPIKTSYDLLWSEIRNTNRSNLTIQNTMRRILENYFKILGSLDLDSLCDHFEGKEKLICRSLLSWVNDGSHFASDDLYISIDDATVDTYLDTFRAVFEKSGHGAHYQMMMGDSNLT